MRIVFVTQDDPVYILPFFDEFFGQDLGSLEVSGIFSCRTMGERGRFRLLRELFFLYGPLGLFRLLGRRLGAGIAERLPSTGKSGAFYSLAQLCRARGIPHEVIGNPNHEDPRARIVALAPEILVSVACPYILKEKLLSVPPRGCVNIHHAPLPRYKGMMPTFWQMYHGERQVGVTIHTMAARVDEGSALLQERLAIVPGESLDSLIRRTKRHGAHCMLKVLRQIEQGTHTPIAPMEEAGSYFTFPTPAEIREFRRRGYRAI